LSCPFFWLNDFCYIYLLTLLFISAFNLPE